MAPSSALRSFTIAVAIVIAIIEPQAGGFTIYHNNTADTQTTDLATENSLQLPVKNDFRIQNNIKGEKGLDLSKHKTTKYILPNDNDKNTTKMITTVSEEMTTAVVHTSTETTKTTENVKIPTISSDTIELFDSTEEVTENRNKVTNTANRKSDNHIERVDTTKSVMTTETEYNIISTTETTTETNTTNVFTIVTDQFNTETETTQDKSTTLELASSIQDSDSVTTITSGDFETHTEIVNTSGTNPLSTDSTIGELPTTTDIPTMLANENETTLPYVTTFASVGSKDMTTNNSNDKTTIEPSWKRYTTIERKRVTSTEVVSKTSEHETMKAATSNSHANFKKAYNYVGTETIPSSEKLRVDLLSDKNPMINKEEIISEETAKTILTMEPTIPSLNTIADDYTKKTATVETKRGGFLNFSEKTTTPLVSEIITTEEIRSDQEAHLPTMKTESSELERPEPEKERGTESQSQLTEYVIREELLKEEALNNYEQNINRYGEGRDEKRVRPLDDDTPSEDVGTETSGDSLSVRPINYERTKTTLYTISPNYKPMKKIDVQPAKPFVRDPDDNSWRNESISSLGIVFKPKNSSKSFKEVLKNKTQIELNNLQEKYSKEDVPDLRVRLEKIAEGRKIKKKKTNLNGEEVYTDYEEGSSESSKETTTTPGLISPGLTSVEIPSLTTPKFVNLEPEVNSTPAMITTNQMVANKEKTNVNKHELFQSLGLDSLTTEKAKKKLFNIAEYYDTTDEYDADYVTMSKIDLKKHFAVPPRTTERPMTTPLQPTPTEPMKPYFPDRKPTIQYFPPRSAQKVNLNNLDKDFERKINLFTFNEHAALGDQPDPRPSFITVPPSTIATEKPELRPTVKPTDVSMYTPSPPDKNFYTTIDTSPPTQMRYVVNDENFNRGSYIIKHYKDFLNAAGKADDDRGAEFVPYSRPAPSSTLAATLYTVTKPTTKEKEMDYDYDLQFRKDVMNRFVDNFNQNSERFKVDFPILYNNSVVHRKDEDNGRAVASSRAFLKRLYGGAPAGAAARPNALMRKPCEPDCDVTVELSPAYELHYYVPDQEEKEEAQRPPPYPLRL